MLASRRFHFQRPHGDGGELVVLDRHEAHDAEAEARRDTRDVKRERCGIGRCGAEDDGQKGVARG